VRIANDNRVCGLSAAVFSRDITRALMVAKRIQSGMCHINGPNSFATKHTCPSAESKPADNGRAAVVRGSHSPSSPDLRLDKRSVNQVRPFPPPI
jgi:acyl-CoA reductase-like NAD-dependent aldehyde dehydrogenase